MHESYTNSGYQYGDINPDVKTTATTANPTPIPITVYNLAQSIIHKIPNPPIRRFQGEEGPSTPSGDNPPKVQQPKATVMALHTREDTPWPNTILASTNLFATRASWPMPPNETSTPIFIKTEKAEERTPLKITAISNVMVNKPPLNKAEEMCGWGPHWPVCTKSTPNSKAENSEDWDGNGQDQLERNYCPPSP